MVFHKLWRLQILRFGAGGGLILSLKLFMTWCFNQVGLPLWFNYAVVQCLIVVLSYYYHSKITFYSAMSFAGFFRFFLSVSGLKLIDYGLVIFINHISLFQEMAYSVPFFGGILGDYLLYVTIIGSTVLIFIFRYFLFKKLIFSIDKSTTYTNKKKRTV